MAAQSRSASPPGTPDYFPAIVTRIRNAAPNLSLEPVILQSLLLCLVAGEKNLILRTREEDVGLVLKITASHLTTIFNYTTQRVKLRSKQPPQEFLRSLFLSSPSSTASYKSKRPNSRKSVNTAASSFVQRSSSYPSEITSYAPNPANPFGDHNNITPTASSSYSPLLTPERNRDEQQSEISVLGTPDTIRRRSKLRPPFSQAFPDADSASGPHSPSAHSTLTLPKALIISGLENVGVPAQRTFMQMLGDKRLVLEDDGGEVWNLPSDFMVVYVCTWDERERPAIHNGLLDRFAMSANVAVNNNIREAYTSRNSHSRSDTNVQGLSAGNPIITPSELASLRALAASPTRVYIHPSLSLYIADLFAATRHHPELDGTLLSRRAHVDVEDLVRAYRVIFGDSTGTDLIRSVTGEKIDVNWSDAHLRPPQPSTTTENYENDIDDVTTVRVSWEWKDGEVNNGFSKGSGYEPEEDPNEADDQASRDHEVMDVSEVDVATVVPRIISHRIRVRGGPDEEILGSVMFCAVGPPPRFAAADDNVYWENKTVKDIVVKILADV